MAHLRTHYHKLLFILLFAVIIALFTSKLDDMSNYHGDENIWIPMGSMAFERYFMQHDFSNPFWSDDYFSFGAYNPQIGKYIIGSGIYLAGYRDLPFMPFYWQYSLAWNAQQGLLPDTRIVAVGRLPVAVLGALSCASLFWLAALVADYWHAYLAVASLVGGRLLLNSSRRAMLDTPALCFGLLTLVGMYYLLAAVRTGSRRRACLWAAGVGLMNGLALGSKMTALLILMTCVAVLLLEWTRACLEHGDRVIAPVCGAIVVCGAAGVFVASNPFLYPDPIGGTAHMLDFARIVADTPSTGKTATLAAKIQALWANNLRYAPLNQLGLPGDNWLLLAGVVGLAATAWRDWRGFWERSLGLIAIWIVITYVGIGLWLPNNWDRYTLPIQPCSAFLQAYGLIWLWRMSSVLWKRM